ncbi:MAG: OmpL47-type beta-barrel domain-containing protein, partial [Nitrosotalea sp.]
NNPGTTALLSPSPASPLQGLTFYSNPVTVTLTASADAGYSIANTYYKVDGGSQQTYTEPFTINGTGKHTVEYWSIDNSGISESPHLTKSFTINYQHATITSIDQNGIGINAAIHISNSPYAVR